ncbi:MAG: polyamine aminopropyltransferase [Actinomycetota bacterium]
MSEFGERIAEGLHTVYDGELLHAEQTPFQKLEIFDHPHFGRVLVLDGLIQTTQSDEFCYHEMLVHPALTSLERVERVLIIGGGDGGTLRRVLEHGPTEVVICEIDERVIDVCREFMPDVSAGAFDDQRVRLEIGDGAAFTAGQKDAFDAVVIDGSDAIGPAAVLFSREFYGSCRRALRANGLLVTQSGSPMYQLDEFRMAFGNLSATFDTVEPLLSFVPTYPGALWSYTTATDGKPVSLTSPLVVRLRLAERDISTRFYTPELHQGVFALPSFVRDICAAAVPASVPRG